MNYNDLSKSTKSYMHMISNPHIKINEKENEQKHCKSTAFIQNADYLLQCT